MLPDANPLFSQLQVSSFPSPFTLSFFPSLPLTFLSSPSPFFSLLDRIISPISSHHSHHSTGGYDSLQQQQQQYQQQQPYPNDSFTPFNNGTSSPGLDVGGGGSVYSANGGRGGGGIEAGPSVLTVSSFGTTNQGGVVQRPDSEARSSLGNNNNSNNNNISPQSSHGTALGVTNNPPQIDRNSLNAELRMPVRKNSRQFATGDANGAYNPDKSREFGGL